MCLKALDDLLDHVWFHDFLFSQEHLLKMTTQHRTEMTVKRGKPTFKEEG